MLGDEFVSYVLVNRPSVGVWTASAPWASIFLLFSFVAVVVLFYCFSYRFPLLAKPPAKIQSIAVNDSKTFKADYDVIVVGGGVVGSALAAALGRQGRRVLVLESDLSEPHRIVGELLQPTGVHKLRELGLSEYLEKFDAQDVPGYAIIYNGETIRLTYPCIESVPVFGKGFHNGRFVMSLRKAATAQATVELRQGHVTKLLMDNSPSTSPSTSPLGGRITGVQYRTKDSDTVLECRAHLTVVADGCFSSFRTGLSHNAFSVSSSFLGLILEDCKLPFPNAGHVMLVVPTPVLAYPISSNEVRMLIDFPTTVPDHKSGELQKHLMEHLYPQLPEELKESFTNAVKKGGFQSMPNRRLVANPALMHGLLLVGDALNMRHPLTGGGMSVGLTDVAILAKAFKSVSNFSNSQELLAAVDSFYRVRRAPNRVINILANALYGVFHQRHPELRDACFYYLKRGGLFSDGPVKFLSGLSRSQPFLIFHFFAVAVYGCGYQTLRGRPDLALKMFRDAVRIIAPLAVEENHHPFCTAVFKPLCWILRV